MSAEAWWELFRGAFHLSFERSWSYLPTTYLKEVSPGAKGAQKNSDKWPPVTRHRHTPTQQPTNTPNTEHRMNKTATSFLFGL
jgi:hypothetical protein